MRFPMSGRPQQPQLARPRRRGSGEGTSVRVALFSTDSAKDRTVANVCLVVFLQPLGHFTTDRQIRQMVRRACCAPQLNRSLPCQLAIWLLARSLRRGGVGGHLATKPVEKILFDDRK